MKYDEMTIITITFHLQLDNLMTYVNNSNAHCSIKAHAYDDQQTYNIVTTQSTHKYFSHHQAILVLEAYVSLLIFFSLLLTKLMA